MVRNFRNVALAVVIVLGASIALIGKLSACPDYGVKEAKVVRKGRCGLLGQCKGTYVKTETYVGESGTCPDPCETYNQFTWIHLVNEQWTCGGGPCTSCQRTRSCSNCLTDFTCQVEPQLVCILGQPPYEHTKPVCTYTGQKGCNGAP